MKKKDVDKQKIDEEHRSAPLITNKIYVMKIKNNKTYIV
jgi:hypothetical protein